MNAASSRYSAADFLALCRAALRASEASADPAAARRHARRAIRLATLGERQARLHAAIERGRQRTGFSTN